MKNFQLTMFIAILLFSFSNSTSVFDHLINKSSTSPSKEIQDKTTLAKRTNSSTTTSNLSKTKTSSPSIVSLDNSIKGTTVFGEYEFPDKLWYYKKFFSRKESWAQDTAFEYSKYYSQLVKIPQEMKELTVYSQFCVYLYHNGSGSGSRYAEVALFIDDTLIDEIVYDFETCTTCNMFRTPQLEGSVFNAIAGTHEFSIRFKTNDKTLIRGYNMGSPYYSMVGYMNNFSR